MRASVLLVTTLVVTCLADGPGHEHGHGHHGEHHHGAHHATHHAAPHAAHPTQQKHAAPPKPAARQQVHHVQHAQHPKPVQHAKHAQPHGQPQRAAPRPVPVRAVRKPLAVRPRPPQQPVRRPQASPFNLFGLAQQSQRLPHVPRPVRGLHNNLPDRAPGRRPQPPHPHHLRRPNINQIPGTPTKAPAPAVTKAPGKSVAALIAENEHFSTLHTALKAAGMMERLAGPGPFTVFAPTNAAFDKVPVDSLNKLMENKEELIKVLERHIVPGVRMEGKEVPDGQTKLKSASGDELSTDRDNFVKVSTPSGSAFVVKFDFLGKNGVYHAVDQVL